MPSVAPELIGIIELGDFADRSGCASLSDLLSVWLMPDGGREATSAVRVLRVPADPSGLRRELVRLYGTRLQGGAAE